MSMNTNALEKLRSYWEELRKGRLAPYRAELDPRRFEDVLEHMFILEQLGPDQVRTRLAGMALCEMMGMEVRGMPPEAFISAPHRVEFSALLANVLGTPSIMEMDLTTEDVAGRPVKARMLLLPLRSDFGEVTRILGCVVADRSAIKAPVNFRIDSHRETAVKATVAEPDRTDPPLPGFTEPPRPFLGQGAVSLRSIDGGGDGRVTAPRRGHLRVVSRN